MVTGNAVYFDFYSYGSYTVMLTDLAAAVIDSFNNGDLFTNLGHLADVDASFTKYIHDFHSLDNQYASEYEEQFTTTWETLYDSVIDAIEKLGTDVLARMEIALSGRNGHSLIITAYNIFQLLQPAHARVLIFFACG